MARLSSVSLAASQIINRVAFEGNKQIETKQLEVEVQSKPHTAYNEATADADVGRIKDAYKKYGRNEAGVTKRLVQLPNGRVDLVFTVNEGEKTGIREINFVGNQRVSNYRLHSLMQTSTMNWLSWFKSTDVYDPDRLASDEEAIRRYYMKNGYADFQITNTDVDLPRQSPGLCHHDHGRRGSPISRLVSGGGFQYSEGGWAGPQSICRSKAWGRL